MKNRHREHGFSYIEITIVLAISAIILAIGIPFFIKGRANARVRTSANEFKAGLELARSQAKTTGADVKAEFVGSPASASGYNIVEANGRVIKSELFSEAVFIDASALSGPSPLKFTANGTSTQEGNILVKSGNTDKYFTISIVKATGLIKIEETR
jgi:prepilin-type N-terminal cleavage/methylation domain-containing protein